MVEGIAKYGNCVEDMEGPVEAASTSDGSFQLLSWTRTIR